MTYSKWDKTISIITEPMYGKKLPQLLIVDGNIAERVATFPSVKKAELFEKILRYFFGRMLVEEKEETDEYWERRPEIVRCKDCKYFHKAYLICENDSVVSRITDFGCCPDFSVSPDWFCADGKRKDNVGEYWERRKAEDSEGAQ